MDDTITITSSTNFSSVHNKHIYNSDRGFHIIKRSKNPRGHFALEFYETPNSSDCRIRNAVTGLWYRDDHPKCKYLVGSRQEDLFFKVRISTGEPEIGNKENRKNTYLLFYDSPEQYERHQKTTVKQEEKEKWQEKNLVCKLQNKFLYSED